MADLLRTYRSRVRKIPQGVDLLWHRMAGQVIRYGYTPSFFLRSANEVVAREALTCDLSDSKLRSQCVDFRLRFQRGRETKADLLAALAVLREASRRIRGEHPYREQVAAALSLLSGCVAELATGEGKTLSMAMAAILEGWRGRGCHVVTVNDYLARRDAETMAELYRFCGVRTAYLVEESPDTARPEAYRADVLYATNKTLAADFLRNQVRKEACRGGTVTWDRLSDLTGEGEASVMRALNSAFVDEADSILIDEAVTPLLLSGEGKNREQEATFHQAREMADSLEAGREYRLVDREQNIVLTETGANRLAGWSDRLGGVFAGRRRTRELVTRSLMAKHFYQQGKQYVVQDRKVVIVDEFTGRLMPDREWRDGLHQAVSARENAEVTASKETLARISFQRFFRMYSKLGGMTGTAREARREFWDVYTLPVVCLPTHRPCVRKYPAAQVFTTAAEKRDGIVCTVRNAHELGRAVLVGTRSVQASAVLSRRLRDEGLPHNLLNAERHEEEAEIIRGAGKKGQITVATNMAGRGTDIRLEPSVKAAGGLLVVLTERHDSRRVDFQLFGRCGRQGDPGTAMEVFCMEDEIYRQHFGWLRMFFLEKGELRGWNRLGALVCFGASQWAAQRRARIRRNQLAKVDETLSNTLGFAGREFE